MALATRLWRTIVYSRRIECIQNVVWIITFWPNQKTLVNLRSRYNCLSFSSRPDVSSTPRWSSSTLLKIKRNTLISCIFWTSHISPTDHRRFDRYRGWWWMETTGKYLWYETFEGRGEGWSGTPKGRKQTMHLSELLGLGLTFLHLVVSGRPEQR